MTREEAIDLFYDSLDDKTTWVDIAKGKKIPLPNGKVLQCKGGKLFMTTSLERFIHEVESKAYELLKDYRTVVENSNQIKNPESSNLITNSLSHNKLVQDAIGRPKNTEEQQMFAIVQGTVASSERGKPRLQGNPTGDGQTISFLLNTSVRLNKSRTNMAVMVYHNGQNLENVYRWISAGRKVEVRGNLTFGLRTEIIVGETNEQNKHETRLVLNIQTVGPIIFLDDEPVKAAEDFFDTMFEANIITAEQKQDFTNKMTALIKSGKHATDGSSPVPQQQVQQQLPETAEDANDLSALDMDVAKPDDKDIPI